MFVHLFVSRMMQCIYLTGNVDQMIVCCSVAKVESLQHCMGDESEAIIECTHVVNGGVL